MEQFETEAGQRLYEKISDDEPYALRDKAFENGLTKEDHQYLLNAGSLMEQLAGLLKTQLGTMRMSDAYGDFIDLEDYGIDVSGVDIEDAELGHDWAVYTKEVLNQVGDAPLASDRGRAFRLDGKVELLDVYETLLDDDFNPEFDREELQEVGEEFAHFFNQNTSSEPPHYFTDSYLILHPDSN